MEKQLAALNFICFSKVVNNGNSPSQKETEAQGNKYPCLWSQRKSGAKQGTKPHFFYSKYWTIPLHGNTSGLDPIPPADSLEYILITIAVEPLQAQMCTLPQICMLYHTRIFFLNSCIWIQFGTQGRKPQVSKQRSCHFLDPQEDVTERYFVFFHTLTYQ